MFENERGIMNITYDSKSSTISTKNNHYEFYCGEVLTGLAKDLFEFQEGELTLQQVYTLMLQRINEGDIS